MTFVEVLVVIVLLGLATIGTMTALQVSIKGSDQHRSRVGTLADLQGAGAYLAREGHIIVCPGATAAQIQSLLAGMPGSLSNLPPTHHSQPGDRRERFVRSSCS